MTRASYTPPAIDRTELLGAIDTHGAGTVPTALAVVVALSYALRADEPGLSAMLACRARLRWTALPKRAQGLFNSICEELGLSEPSITRVHAALFR